MNARRAFSLVVLACLTLACRASGTFTVGTGTEALTFSYDYVNGTGYLYSFTGPSQYTIASPAGQGLNSGTGIYAGASTVVWNGVTSADLYQNVSHTVNGYTLLGTLNLSTGVWAPVDQDHTLTVKLTIRNNLNATQTITCGNAPSQVLGGLTSSTLTFVATGKMGTPVPLTSSPGTLTLEGGVTDPLVISGADATAQRSAHIGQPGVTRKVDIVVLSWATTSVDVTARLDGSVIGKITAQPTTDSGLPKTTEFTYNIELSPDSILAFSSTEHAVTSQTTDFGDVLSVLVKVDQYADAVATIIQGAGGSTTVTATNTATGTTSITRTSPGTATNTDTTPAGIFGGAQPGSQPSGATYGNTGASAGSAASQDAANSLAAIKDTSQQTANNTSSLLKLLSPPSNYTPDADLAIAQAKSNMATAYGGPQPNGIATATVPAASANPTLATWKIGDNEVTVSMLPTQHWQAADSLLRACRPLLTLAALVAFCWSCTHVLNTYISSLPTVGQAEANVGIENLIPGVSQGKTWGAAGLIVGAMVVCCAAMVVVLNTWMSNNGYSIANLYGATNLGPLGSGVALIDAYIPIATIAQLGILRAGFSFLVAPIYLGTAGVMKFLKA